MSTHHSSGPQNGSTFPNFLKRKLETSFLQHESKIEDSLRFFPDHQKVKKISLNLHINIIVNETMRWLNTLSPFLVIFLLTGTWLLCVCLAVFTFICLPRARAVVMTSDSFSLGNDFCLPSSLRLHLRLGRNQVLLMSANRKPGIRRHRVFFS